MTALTPFARPPRPQRNKTGDEYVDRVERRADGVYRHNIRHEPVTHKDKLPHSCSSLYCRFVYVYGHVSRPGKIAGPVSASFHGSSSRFTVEVLHGYDNGFKAAPV